VSCIRGPLKGEVVGIVLGWMFGAVGVYLLGLLLLWKWCRVKGEQDGSRVGN
jgi:hypothetical protein